MRRKTFLIILIILIAFAIPVGFFIIKTRASSPKPVTIVAPKTTVTENNNSYINSLFIDMSQKEKLTLNYLDQDSNKRNIVINANDRKKMDELIQQTIEWAGNGQELKVLIGGHKEANYSTFQTVVETLKRKGIYKYKLISTQNENEHQTY